MIGLRTNLSRRPPPLPGPTARQREREADEARWEAQIRRLAALGTREAGPVAARLPALSTTALDLAAGMTRHDTLLLPRTLPLITGSEAEDLACGRCGAVIASRTSRQTARSRHPGGRRLVVRCTCRALNLLWGRAGRRRAGRNAGA